MYVRLFYVRVDVFYEVVNFPGVCAGGEELDGEVSVCKQCGDMGGQDQAGIRAVLWKSVFTDSLLLLLSVCHLPGKG